MLLSKSTHSSPILIQPNISFFPHPLIIGFVMAIVSTLGTITWCHRMWPVQHLLSALAQTVQSCLDGSPISPCSHRRRENRLHRSQFFPWPQAFSRVEITSSLKNRMSALTEYALKIGNKFYICNNHKADKKRNPVKMLPHLRNVHYFPCSGNDIVYAPIDSWWDLTFPGPRFSYQLLKANGKSQALMCKITENGCRAL